MALASDFFRLNFHSFDKAWILNYVYSLLRESISMTEWKKEILYFIIDWLSSSDEIKTSTSGSTGTPKTISLKKENVKNSAKATLDFFELQSGDNFFLTLPVKYIAGKLMIVRALEGKMNLYCSKPSLTPFIEDVSFQFAAMTPSQVALLMETSKGIAQLNRIKKLIIGGDKIPAETEMKLQKLKTEVWHTYGMTETITHIAVRKVNGKDRSDFFKPLPGINITTSDDDCLVIDAPHIGVHFIKTNDIVELTKNGYIKIKGRKDNVVNSGGIKLFPEYIEKKIENIINYPFFFTGIPDSKLGSKLVMVIESSSNFDKEKLLNTIQPHLEKFEIPKDILIVEKFERTETGKIKRKI